MLQRLSLRFLFSKTMILKNLVCVFMLRLIMPRNEQVVFFFKKKLLLLLLLLLLF
jgi:hypothetical protein